MTRLLWWWLLTGLALVVTVLAVGVTWRPRSSPDCAGRIVIGRGPHGEPIECVCVGGTISTCFEPGP